MKNRSLLVVLLLVVLAVIGGAVFLMGQDPDPAPKDGGDAVTDVDDGTTDTGDTATSDADADAEREAERKRAKRRRARRWVNKGHGSLVGKLLEYGTDEPVAGVTVKLVGAEDGPNQTLDAVSGTDGTFIFDGVPQFDGWELVAEAQDPLAPAQVGDVEVVAHRQNDAGVIYLSPGFALSGIVVDPSGKPIADALVRAVRSRPSGMVGFDLLKLVRELPREAKGVDRAETDTKGKFQLTKTPPGSYDMFVSAAGHQLRVRRGVLVNPDTAGEELRFVLPEGFPVNGRVVRAGAGQVEGLTVVAFPEPNGAAGFMTLDEKSFASTDAQGKFAFDGLRSADYIFAVTPDGEPTVISDDLRIPGTEFVELRLEGKAFLEGRVTDQEKQPIEGAEVFLIMEGSADAPTFASQLTDADGRYRLDGLPIADVQAVVVRKTGYASYPSDPRGMFGGRGGESLVIQEGRNEKNVELIPGGTVKGLVIGGEKDEPIAGVKVSLVSQTSMFLGQNSATTGADGTFELTGVPKGSAILSISKEGWNAVDDPLANPMGIMSGMRGGDGEEDAGEGAVIVISKPGDVIERTLKMEPSLSVAGRVLDPSGKPVAGAQVTLEAPGMGGGMGRMMAMFMGTATPRLTDSDGRFEVPGARAGKPSVVRVKAKGFVEATSDPVTPTAGGETVSVEVKLQVGATIEGLVKNKAGEPVMGAQVSWSEKAQGGGFNVAAFVPREPVFTGADGRYSIQNAGVGDIQLSVEHGDYVDVDSVAVKTAEGKSVTKDFTLDEGQSITGRVVGPNDEPIAGARVNVSGGVWESTRAAEDGTFKISGLAPGKYTVNARAEGFTNVSLQEFEAGSGEAVLRLEKALKVSGLVRFADGRPAANVYVTAHAEGSSGQGDQTGSDGSFEIDGLAAGTYTLDVAPGWGDGERPNVIGKKVESVAAGTSGVVIEVEKGLVVRGTVTYPDGREPEDGWVNGHPITADGQHDRTRSNANVNGTVRGGKIYVGGLEPGRYRLSVRIGAQNRTVDVEAGDENVRIELGETGAVSGRVVTPSGVTFVNVSISVYGSEGSSWSQGKPDGTFEAAGLPAGRYTVTVSAFAADGKQFTGTYEGVEVVANGVATVPDIEVTEDRSDD